MADATANGAVRPRGAKPVSYTHLDVYKRQLHTLVTDAGGPFGDGVQAVEGLSLIHI